MKDFHKIEEKLKRIEAEFGSLEEFVFASTFGAEKHTLKTKDFSSCKKVFDEKLFQELELAEISDFWAGENGEFETW